MNTLCIILMLISYQLFVNYKLSKQNLKKLLVLLTDYNNHNYFLKFLKEKFIMNIYVDNCFKGEN